MKAQDAEDAASKQTGPKMGRRKMLKTLGGLSASLSVSPFIPPHVRKALESSSAPRGSFKDIKHVVLLMQENRSFDHYFGTMSGVRGFDDPHAMKLDSGRSVFHQPDAKHPDGYLLPFHFNTRTTNAQKIPSTSHSWGPLHDSWNHGKMDNWIQAHRKVKESTAHYVMGYYTRQDIPFHFALAEAFTICDGYHCSVMGPTIANRLYWLSGTFDPEGQFGGPITGTGKIPKGGYRWKTYAERLEEAGVSWKVYQEEKVHPGYDELARFKRFKEAGKDSPLYKKGVMFGPTGQFEYDAINDKLPAVSWLIPNNYQSEHPDYLPADGATFIASKIDAIAANPEVWAKTVFILNYDENDGLFDHVAPPVPKPGTPHEFVNGLPIGAGFRVPCIIVSPWTAGGWVCNDLFDHSSCLRFLERFTGVREPNISQWRRDTFGDLTSAFRFSDTQSKGPVLPDTYGPLMRAKYEVENLPTPGVPGSEQSMPVQEKGPRKKIRS